MVGRIALVLVSVAACLLALELGLRLVLQGPQGLIEWPNIVRYERVSIRAYSAKRAEPHPVLGFVGLPNYRSPGFNFDERGLRVTPTLPYIRLKEPPILAVGGSFTLGDEVEDHETMPTQLQAAIDRRVINAGMSAYGLDQMVLRAEIMVGELAAKRRTPLAIVLSFGADNLRRSEMSRVWGIEKPYFELVNGRLELRNVPVPPSPDPATTLDFWQRLLGRSLLVDFVLRRLRFQYEWALDHVRVLPRGEGARLACPLFKRLAALGVPVLVVVEYDPYLWTDPPYMREQKQLTDSVLRCAEAAGFATLDIFTQIDELMKTEGRAHLYTQGNHFTAAGHALASRNIADELRRMGAR
ncbi:MAG TPA: hypothetical protein VEC14_06065 [Reyranellaceae bacterium]|nr:hypothetical protein [Reyranellaceae bacterium]